LQTRSNAEIAAIIDILTQSYILHQPPPAGAHTHAGGLYTVHFELSTNVTRKENGTERRFNKLTVVKLAEL
jgi:hypothetical protein